MTQAQSRTADKFVVRMPDGMRDRLTLAAAAQFTSMNTLVIKALEQYLNSLDGGAPTNARLEDVAARLEAIADRLERDL